MIDEAGDRLARARFADDRQGLAALEREGDAVDGLRDASRPSTKWVRRSSTARTTSWGSSLIARRLQPQCGQAPAPFGLSRWRVAARLDRLARRGWSSAARSAATGAPRRPSNCAMRRSPLSTTSKTVNSARRAGREQVFASAGRSTRHRRAASTASTTSSNGMPTASSFDIVVPRSQTGLSRERACRSVEIEKRQKPARDRHLGDLEREGGAAVADIEADALRGAALRQREEVLVLDDAAARPCR